MVSFEGGNSTSRSTGCSAVGLFEAVDVSVAASGKKRRICPRPTVTTTTTTLVETDTTLEAELVVAGLLVVSFEAPVFRPSLTVTVIREGSIPSERDRYEVNAATRLLRTALEADPPGARPAAPLAPIREDPPPVLERVEAPREPRSEESTAWRFA